MIKQLLIASAVTAMALSANAAEVTLWEGEVNLGTDWSESFAVPAADLAVLGDENAVLTFHYTLDTACTYWQFKPCSNGEGWTPLEVASELGNDWNCITVDANSTSYDLPLGATDIATIKANGLRVQGYGMTVTKITTDSEKEIDPNVLWEGELEFTGWSVNGAEVAQGKVRAGDVLTYTFSNAGAENSQALIKASDWNNLLGAAKIVNKDMAKTNVIVGVTQSMLDNCGGKFFLQGEGNFIITKIARTGEFDPTNVIAFGTRSLGAQIFATIPEGTEKIAVEFDAAPTWAQLCDKGWNDKGFTSESSADGKIITWTITPEFVSSVATDKEFIINGGDANLLKVFIPTSSGINGINAENKTVNVYDLAGRVVRRNVESGAAVNGLAKGIYIVNGKKVMVK